MRGALLLIPFLLIRFGLLSCLNPQAVRRAAYFAPLQGGEKAAYWIYQISNAGIFLSLLFLRIAADSSWQFIAGLVCYILGLCLCAASVAGFASPDREGLNTEGIYRFSRNPMYVSYFVCFVGMALLTRSWFLFGLAAVFQVSAHWIILSEERWCVETFGTAYRQYMKTVRRYI